MFPWVYGFEWTPGHVIFTGVFLTVAVLVFSTLALAAIRSIQAFRHGKAAKVAWKSQFHDLPASDRACRHAITGELVNRVCEQGFDCRECAMHARLSEEQTPAPGERLYHRGHTWVEPAADGTLLIGLDEIAGKLIGKPETVEVPSPGSRLEANSPAFTVRKLGAELRLLAPVDGAVLESKPGTDGWLARVRPAEGFSFRHLLKGEEAAAWLQAEVERIQLAAACAGAAPALADGGELVNDVSAVLPAAQWESVCGEILMDV